MLVHQLRGESPSISDVDHLLSKQLALEDSAKETSEDNNTSADVSPTNLMRSSLILKHCNSFNSEILEQHDSPTNDKVVSKIEKRLSADSKILGERLISSSKFRCDLLLLLLWLQIRVFRSRTRNDIRC